MSSRRTFLRTLAVATAATLVQSGTARAAAAVLRSGRIRTSAPVSFAAFASLEGAAFRVSGDGSRPQYWRLAKVQEHRHDARVENFSLTFTGAAASPLPQGIYRLEHPTLGETDLFVVAARIDEESFGYEAVINRLV